MKVLRIIERALDPTSSHEVEEAKLSDEEAMKIILKFYEATNGRAILFGGGQGPSITDGHGEYNIYRADEKTVEIFSEAHTTGHAPGGSMIEKIEKTFLEEHTFEEFCNRYSFIQWFAEYYCEPINMRALWEALLIIFEIRTDERTHNA